MSASAIIMMIIGCGGLWGGFIVACLINFSHNRKAKEMETETEEAQTADSAK